MQTGPDIVTPDQVPLIKPVGNLLKALNGVKAVYMVQRVDRAEVILGYDTANNFSFYALEEQLAAKLETNQPIDYEKENLHKLFHVGEKSNFLLRNLVDESMRSFKLVITDSATNEQVGSTVRPFKCTCFCWGRPYMDVFNNLQEQIGSIQVPLNCCSDYLFQVKQIENLTSYGSSDGVSNQANEKKTKGEGNLIYCITGDCCSCGTTCRDCPCQACQNAIFPIRDTTGEVKGKIQKKSAGFIKELVSAADNYIVHFPDQATDQQKLLLICAAVMLDYQLYENVK